MASRILIVVMARSTSIILVAVMRLELIMVISAVEVAMPPPHTVTMAASSPHVILVVTTSVHTHVVLSVVVASAPTSHVIMVGPHLTVVVVAVVAVAWVLLASSSWRHLFYSIR